MRFVENAKQSAPQMLNVFGFLFQLANLWCVSPDSLSGCPIAAASKLNKVQDKQVILQPSASEASSNSDRVLR